MLASVLADSTSCDVGADADGRDSGLEMAFGCLSHSQRHPNLLTVIAGASAAKI